MRFLRLTRAEWAGLAVLLAAAWYGSQWLAARDARVSGQASVSRRLEDQERKIDALLSWADLLSQLQGWPRPRIPERPVALPAPPPPAPDDESNPGGPPAAEVISRGGHCP